MNLRYCEKKLSEFQYIEDTCEEFHFDEFGEVICEVGSNNGGDCYPWDCPRCDFIGSIEYGVGRMGNMEVIELVEVIREVIDE
jgi:hypothetical protein